MTESIDVCHVLNTVRGTSTVVDIANKQRQMEPIDSVGILSWFDIEPFNTDDLLDIHCLNIPDDVLHITKSQYRAAKLVLSEYDIIHTHRNHSGFYAKLIAKHLGKPIIVTHHNNHTGFTIKGRIANAVTNIFASDVVCVSESVSDSFASWERILTPEHKVSVIHNGVDVTRLDVAQHIEWSIDDVVDIDSASVVVGSAGMLTEQKAHDVLIEAVDTANERSDQPIELVISGDGELHTELDRQIQSATYSDKLHLLGFLDEREQVYKMMHEIDIYAMPSRWEGFCVAALEAMAIGNACVFSDIKEFHDPFRKTSLFHPVDDADSLAERLVQLADDNELREQLATEARDHICSTYTLKNTADQYMQIYSNMLSRCRSK